MAEIRWTNYAFLDLKNIFDYIARDSKKYAYHQTKKLQEKTKILKDNPNLGRKVPELDKDDIRELIEGNYRIIYKILSKDQIDIISVFHSARLLRIDERI